MEVKQSQFATFCGVSRAAISKKVKNNTLIVNSAGMLDTDNPVNRAYLDKQKARKELRSVVTPTKTFTGSIKNSDAGDKQLTPIELLNMPLREIVQTYGSVTNVERYAKLLKDLTTADEKDQRIQERRLVQIPKDFVTNTVFGLLETLMQKLLDIPDRLADQVIAYVQADVTSARQRIINTLSDNISVSIADAKQQIINKIENMKSKYDQEDIIQDAVNTALENKE